MSACATTLNNAKALVIAAAGAFAAAPPAVAIAIALNGGFFTAPGAPIPMVVAGIAATAAAVLLKQALDALNDWVRSGCLSRECAGKFYNIRNALAASITTIGLLATACFAIAAVAWIPWVSQPGMWAVYAPMLLAGVSLGTLAAYWGRLSQCQTSIASARGPLMAGEKASDPWFLRIKPKFEPSYTKSIGATYVGDHISHSQWLECQQFEVHEWQISAIAYILGSPVLPVDFKWKFAGNAVSPSAIQSALKESTALFNSPSTGATAMLEVTASDNTGFSRSLQVEVSLSTMALSCKLILHFVPPLYQVPSGGPGPVEISREMDNLLTSIRTAIESKPLAERD